MIEQDLEPEIVSMGTTQGLRIKRIGVVYFIESAALERKPAEQPGEADRVETVWKVVAVAKGEDARREAHEWLARANVQVAKMMRKGAA